MNGISSSCADESVDCPLCMEPLEVDDLNFYPCTCGYQVSLWRAASDFLLCARSVSFAVWMRERDALSNRYIYICIYVAWCVAWYETCVFLRPQLFVVNGAAVFCAQFADLSLLLAPYSHR